MKRLSGAPSRTLSSVGFGHLGCLFRSVRLLEAVQAVARWSNSWCNGYHLGRTGAYRSLQNRDPVHLAHLLHLLRPVHGYGYIDERQGRYCARRDEGHRGDCNRIHLLNDLAKVSLRTVRFERRQEVEYYCFAPSSRVISIIVRRNPARAKRRCAGLFPSAVESTARGAPLALSASNVASSNTRPTPCPRWAGST